MGVLDGKIVLVTGAGRGLGASIADRCVSDGATVLAGDIAFVEDVAGTAQQIELDVTHREAWSRAADIVRRDYGRLDVLVNNAGILRAVPLSDVTVDEFRHTLDVNVIGALHGIQTFLQLRGAADGAGSIVNIASVRGLVGGHGLASYSASKFALRGLTKVAAIELGPVGVRVNAVCPGPVVTDMMMAEQLGHLDWEGYLAQIPVGRFGRPDDVAAAVSWLASDDSSFVSGTEIIVDGGLTASGISPQPPRPL